LSRANGNLAVFTILITKSLIYFTYEFDTVFKTINTKMKFILKSYKKGYYVKPYGT